MTIASWVGTWAMAALLLASNPASAQDLRKAIFEGDLAAVRTALARQPATDARDSTGWTLMMTAAAYAKGPRVEIVRALLDAGATIDAVNDNGDTALIAATHYARDNAAVVGLLIERGANVNATRKDGRTALGSAAFNLEAEAISALLKAGARVEAVDADGNTPLLLASAEAYVPPHASDQFFEGREAAVLGCLESLLTAGANPNVKNKKGETPIALVRERWEPYRHRPTIAQRLLLAGAK